MKISKLISILFIFTFPAILKTCEIFPSIQQLNSTKNQLEQELSEAKDSLTQTQLKKQLEYVKQTILYLQQNPDPGCSISRRSIIRPVRPGKSNPKITSKTVTIELGKGVTAINAHIEPTNQDVSLSSDHPSKNIAIPSSHSFEFQRRECHVFAPPAIGTECSFKKDNMIQDVEDLTLQFFTKKNHKNEQIVAYFSYKQLSSKKNKIVINANNVTLNGKTLRISK